MSLDQEYNERLQDNELQEDNESQRKVLHAARQTGRFRVSGCRFHVHLIAMCASTIRDL